MIEADDLEDAPVLTVSANPCSQHAGVRIYIHSNLVQLHSFIMLTTHCTVFRHVASVSLRSQRGALGHRTASPHVRHKLASQQPHSTYTS